MPNFKQQKLSQLDTKFKMVFTLPNSGVSGAPERRVEAPIPDNFGFTLSNNYTTPFDVGSLGGLFQRANALAGRYNGGRTLSAAPGIGMDKVFTNPEPTEISFTIDFAAYYSAKEEVVYPVLNLLMMTAAHSITWGEAKETIQNIADSTPGLLRQISRTITGSSTDDLPPPADVSPDGLTPPPKYAKLISEKAAKYNVPPEYLAAMAYKESSYDGTKENPEELSAANGGGHAYGLYQYTPQTAKALGIDRYSDEEQADAAAKQLRQHYEEFGNWDDAATAHFAGPGNLRRYLNDPDGLPPNTRAYKADVSSKAGLIKSVWTPETDNRPLVLREDYNRQANEANNVPGSAGDSDGKYTVPTGGASPEGIMSLVNFMQGPGRVNITIGDFYEMPDTFINSLAVEFSNLLDNEGLPLSAKCSLTIVPERVLTDKVLTQDWFPNFDLIGGVNNEEQT